MLVKDSSSIFFFFVMICVKYKFFLALDTEVASSGQRKFSHTLINSQYSIVTMIYYKADWRVMVSKLDASFMTVNSPSY